MVTDPQSIWLPNIGERVEVDWGLETIEATVVEAYATGSRPRVIVRVDPGLASDDSATVTVPLSAVRPVETESNWSRGFNYEKTVEQAVQRATADSHYEIDAHSTDELPDFVVRRAGQSPVFVEVKYFAHRSSSKALDQAVRQLRNYLVHHGPADGLLVLNVEIPESYATRRWPHIRAVTWRDEQDDQALRNALVALAEAS